MTMRGDEWASWEVDPSTRSSVHLWTKYMPLKGNVGTTAATLLSVDKGIPAVNLIRNPNFEAADLTEFEKVSTGNAAQLEFEQDDENTSSPAADTNGGDKLLKVSRTTGNSTQHYDGVAYLMGPVHADASGKPTKIHARVSAAALNNAAGNIKLKIWDAGATGSTSAAPLAESDAVNLTTSWQSLTVTYTLPQHTGVTDVRIGVVADEAWAMNTYPYWLDKMMAEVRIDGGQEAYVDGSLPSSGGATYEWMGTANASVSRKKAGISRVRGLRIVNVETYHATNNILYIAIDDGTATATNGIPVYGGETFETNWPIDASDTISVIASSAATKYHGAIWGVHQN